MCRVFNKTTNLEETQRDQGENESLLKWKEDCILSSFILKSFLRCAVENSRKCLKSSV